MPYNVLRGKFDFGTAKKAYLLDLSQQDKHTVRACGLTGLQLFELFVSRFMEISTRAD